ncbi:protease [Halobacteriales archaeon QS_4_69_31]|nr:MAG: protease [Halobacteriales archaeon QS_4_69_31]
MADTLVGWIGQNLPLFLLLAGAGLTIAEAFAPGAHFIVLGVALLVAGLVGLLLPPGLGVLGPVVLAGLVLGAGALTFYIYRQFDFYGGKGTDQTTDSDSLRGETGRVTERITAEGGEVKLDDGGFNPYFRARSVSGEIPEGAEVLVMDPGGGNVLTVESVDGLDEIDRELARGRTDDAADDPAASDTNAGTTDVDAELEDLSEDADDREFEPDTV